MKLYRFSPIKNVHQFDEAVIYIVTQLEMLSKLLVKEALPIASVKVFAHYPEEYARLLDFISKKGVQSFQSHTSQYVTLDQPLKLGRNTIEQLGIRVADPYRSQVGCGDYGVADYQGFRQSYRDEDNYIRDATGHTLTMLEFWHPEFDVLGYIVSPESQWHNQTSTT